MARVGRGLIGKRTPTISMAGLSSSFGISNPAECRFIRVTQLDKNHPGDSHLRLLALEFFGALSE
jgi:hypothetical protein